MSTTDDVTTPADSAELPAEPAPLAKVSFQMGMAPRTLEEGWRFAKVAAASELLPTHYQGKPAAVFIAIQMGMEVGLPPMAALQSIFVTNGRPSLYGDGLLAVLRAAPVFRDIDEYFLVAGKRVDRLAATDLTKDDTTAVCELRRRDSERVISGTFSIGQAKRAQLWTKAGPWQQYPDRMLRMRARGFASRDGFADVLKGLRTVEELQDEPPPAAAPEPARDVRRLSSRPAVVDAAPPLVEPLQIGPTLVARVESFMGSDAVITLVDGTVIIASDPADVSDLDKFRESKQPVRLACVRDGDRLCLQAVSIAE